MKRAYQITFVSFLLLVSHYSLPAAATITYEEDGSNFCNPDRGYFPSPGASDSATLVSLRKTAGITLEMVYYHLDDFRKSDILPDSVFTAFRADAAEARKAGCKIIPRFIYNWEECVNPVEAPLARILLHIKQLGPVLRANSDVISHVQAGLIGFYGEWHHYRCTDWNNLNTTPARSQVLFALLDAIPNLNIAVRYPRAVIGIYNNRPLGPDSAFSGSNKSRTGNHNDSFRSGIEDRGTYSSNAIEAEKQFIASQNRYVVQSGETCGSTNKYSGCDSSIYDFKRMHWDAMCYGKGPCGVIPESWKGGGCYDTIGKKLGYRLKMVAATMQDAVRPGEAFSAIVSLVNIGWGKIYNPRGCELVFRNKTTRSTFIVKCDVDPRKWCMTDSIVKVDLRVILPDTMPQGSYLVYLNLPDTAKSIYHRPEYAIRLANKNVWEDSTGYNSLLHTVTVSKTAPVVLHRLNRSASVDVRNFRILRRGPMIDCYLPSLNASVLSFDFFSLAGDLLAHNVTEGKKSGRYRLPVNASQKSQNVCVVRIKGDGLNVGSFLLLND